MNGGIIIAELVCRGFEHSQYNAPFIHTALLAFPEDPVTFIAHPTHIEHTRRALEKNAPLAARRVRWQTTDLPDRSLSPLRRLLWESQVLRRLFRDAHSTNARAIILSSGTDTALVAAKFLMPVLRGRCAVLVILHSVLAGLEDTSRMFHRFRGIWLALHILRPKHLLILVPGRPVLQYLSEVFPSLARDARALDHPSFWEEHEPTITIPPGPIRFGFFGVSKLKGFDIFAAVASAVRSETVSAEFSLVGHLNSPGERSSDFPGVPDASPVALSADEYRQRAHALTYAVWTRVHRRGLAASSAFLDGLSFIKPIICLSSPLIDSYFQELGDIGYRCATVEELHACIRSVVLAPPVERYRRQCAAIFAGRKIFEPLFLSGTLRSIIEEARGTP